MFYGILLIILFCLYTKNLKNSTVKMYLIIFSILIIRYILKYKYMNGGER